MSDPRQVLNINFCSAAYYVYALAYSLGEQKRTLAELDAAALLANPVSELEKAGYRNNRSVGPLKDLLGLASSPLAELLQESSRPELLLVHQSYAESTFDPGKQRDSELMSRAKYFPASLLRKFQLDNIPYFGSFASGCAGLLSLLIHGTGLLAYSTHDSVMCLTADARPPGANYDMLREKILTSDASSGFILGKQRKGFRVLALSYYSSSRTVMPLVEIVKRCVQMVKDLSTIVGLDLEKRGALFHYPNIFTPAWDMVSHYLKVAPERRIVDEMSERAHCLSSDSIISLKKWHRADHGRIHAVVNFGSGLHLGVCLLEEV